jgi:hypothetical protein
MLAKLLAFIRNNESPVDIPYYVGHALLSLIIAAVVSPFLGVYAGLASGASFYIGREIAQWQSGKDFDWPGLLAPLLTCLAVLVLYISVV